MDELWTVEFSLCSNMNDDLMPIVPSIDGEMIVYGTDIFDVLSKAKSRLVSFGFDRIVVHGAYREGYKHDQKGE